MTIKELKNYIDKAYEVGPEYDVEFWIKLDDGIEILADIDSIGQFSVIPDMTLSVKPKNSDLKIYTTKITDEEQFNYRKKYIQLKEQIQNLYNVLD